MVALARRACRLSTSACLLIRCARVASNASWLMPFTFSSCSCRPSVSCANCSSALAFSNCAFRSSALICTSTSPACTAPPSRKLIAVMRPPTSLCRFTDSLASRLPLPDRVFAKGPAFSTATCTAIGPPGPLPPPLSALPAPQPARASSSMPAVAPCTARVREIPMFIFRSSFVFRPPPRGRQGPAASAFPSGAPAGVSARRRVCL